MDNVWTNLGNRLETAWKRPTRPNSKRPKDGEIIDEEKSVRWNREEAVRRQKAWDAECSRLKKAQNAEIEHISEAIELQIQEDIKAETKRSISKKAATIPSLLTITTTVLRHGIPIAHMQSTAVRTLTSLNRNLPPMTQRIPMQSTVFWMSAASQKQDTKPAIAGKLGPKTVP